VRKGRASFLDKHREAQLRILSHLDQKRIYTNDGQRLVAENIADLEEVRVWSKYLTLQIIFEGLINETGDTYESKANSYEVLATKESSRAALTIQERNSDNVLEETGKRDLQTIRILRR
jgi:hypothetical protein